MSGRRWLKFWPQDWQRDPALRSCGAAARGFWMDLLCIAHEGKPYGHVTINGKAASVRQMGSITGTGEKEAVKLLAELEEAGVFSRAECGTIYSRRMVRDAKATEAGREAVEKRWGKEEKKAPDPTSGGTPPPKTGPIRGGDSLEAEAEAEAEKKEERGAKRPRAARLPDGWSPSEEDAAFAQKHGLTPSVVADRFRDFWHSKAGKDACKLDWSATWRNWCRSDAERNPKGATIGSASAPRAWDDDDWLRFAVGDGSRQASLIRATLAHQPGALAKFEHMLDQVETMQ